MALSPQDQADVLEAFHAEFGGPDFTQIAQARNDYPLAMMLLEEDRVHKTSGTKIQRPIWSKKGPPAESLGMYGMIEPTVTDHATHVESFWTRTVRSWSFEDWEMITGSTGKTIFDMLLMRKQDAELAIVEKIENQAMEVAAVGDNMAFYGIPYWIVYNATDGFTGALPGSHTTIGAVNITTHDTFKNYSVTWTNVSEADLIANLLKAHAYTGWKSPVTKEDFLSVRGRDFLYMTDYATKAALVAALRLRNDQLKFDVGVGWGEDTVFGHRIWWVPRLDDFASAAPIYGINRQFYEMHVQAGGELKNMEFPKWSKQPTTHTSVLVFHYGSVCTNRRSCLIAAKSDPLA
jgi:hypothetical protein